ncbi:MAG: HlyD family type I secretion periplasmic adaptor subunit [Magnetospiraceae bacterium]
MSQDQGAPSPIKAAKAPLLAGLLVVGIAFGGIGYWAATAPLSSGAVATGEIVVLSNRKKIQHLEGGIIREIKVAEGDRVTAGQELMILDDVQPRAALDRLQSQMWDQMVQKARLIAERDGADAFTVPAELQAEAEKPALAEIIEGQKNVFDARRNAINSQIAILDQRMVELDQQIVGLEAQVASEERQLELIEEELKGVRELFEKGIERKPRLLALERKMAEIEGLRGQHLSDIARIRQNIGQTKLEKIDLKNRFLNAVVGNLGESQAEIADLEERVLAAKDVLERTTIVAPLDGIVVNLQFHTMGGVVPPRQPVMDIVPTHDELVVMAQVRPQDKDSVNVGLPAEVRLSALSRRKTQTLSGKVIHVSADRLINDITGEPYFEARIRIDKDRLAGLEGIELFPGMPVDVMIVAGERTALQLAAEPILASMWKSFRE